MTIFLASCECTDACTALLHSVCTLEPLSLPTLCAVALIVQKKVESSSEEESSEEESSEEVSPGWGGQEQARLPHAWLSF